MKKTVAALLAFYWLFLPCALANQSFRATTAHSAGSLYPYTTLLVRDLGTDRATISNVAPDTEERFNRIRVEMVRTFTDTLVNHLRESFPKVRRYGNNTGVSRKTAIVEGSFTSIDAGRRGMRMWIGYSGTASAAIQAKVVDAASGKVLAVFIRESSEPLGWAGSERVLLHITAQLAKETAQYLEKLR